MKREPVDADGSFDWSKASDDYRRHRKGYQKDFHRLLTRLGIGLSGQRILDLGTGTGELALHFSSAGARVTGVDIAEGQIQTARRRRLHRRGAA